MMRMAPYALLVSLPFIAGLLQLLPWIWATAAVWIWAQLYPVLALRRVYQIGWGRDLGKSRVLAVLHLMLILCGLFGLILLGATSGNPWNRMRRSSAGSTRIFTKKKNGTCSRIAY